MNPEIKIKWVKKAKMWCKTTITQGPKGKEFKQEWSNEKPNA